VLSSVAEYPERIKRLFYTQEINEAGIYLCYFYVNGVYTPVVIDDFFPCHKEGGCAFAYSRDGEIWVSLLEKAWAKLHTTYARTEGGLPCFAFSQLMGVPSESLMHSDQKDTDKFWSILKAADQRKFSMMAASHGQGEVENAEGVISGHAYSLIEIHEIEKDGEEVRILKLRNPWGSGEWTGDWSDKSELWTPELKEQVGLVDGDDGCFWIDLKNYMENFSWTSVCIEANPEKYHHSDIYYTFGDQD
jgi:hypothetical protein